MKNFFKESVYSALIFFGTLIILSVGYATYTWDSAGQTSIRNRASGSTLTSSGWNSLVNNVDYLKDVTDSLALQISSLSFWRTSCPTGFTLIGTSGSQEAFCISTNPEATSSYNNAILNCYNKTPTKAHLCNMEEFSMACASWLTTNLTTVWHWTETIYSLSGNTYSMIVGWNPGNALCNSYGGATIATDTYPNSRCCFR